MTNSLFRRVALFAAFICGFTASLTAQDSGALLNVLVRKGILSDQEAEDVRAELAAESHAAVIGSISGGKSTHSLSIYGRMQIQYAGIGSDAAGAADTNHLFLRRIRLGTKAALGANWVADMNYDFAAEGFDKAILSYNGRYGDTPFSFDVGLRKVNLGMEENISSGSLKAIERSGVTRYFVESANGRRLGAAKYRVGLFLEGSPLARSQKSTGLFYGFAVTNPEQPDGAGGARSTGGATSNALAYWADIGYTGTWGGNGDQFRIGAGIGMLPEQGGKAPSAGHDITVFNVYANGSMGQFELAAEFMSSDVDDGAGVGSDASPWGVWIQPSFAVTEQIELVARYSYTDSDGRGIKVSDGLRSAPGSLTGDNLTEYFLGMNYYIMGPDVKLQFGYVHGTAERGNNEETASGVRSQMQVNF
jgi:hypothetical protein